MATEWATMKRRPSALFLSALAMILCSGCMTYTLYDGDTRPKGELGTIQLGVILAVDGGNLQYIANHDLVVLPGPHALGLTIERGKRSAVACTFDVVVEAGHVYVGVVEQDPAGSGKPPALSVVDKTANLVVARQPPLPSAHSKTRSTPAVPAELAKADRKPGAHGPAPAPQFLGSTNAPPPRNHQPIAPETMAELRRLRQLKSEGLITNEEYLERGHALVGTP